jgi:hypothetical protein
MGNPLGRSQCCAMIQTSERRLQRSQHAMRTVSRAAEQEPVILRTSIRRALIIAFLAVLTIAGLIAAGLSWGSGIRLLIWAVILLGAIIGVWSMIQQSARPALADWNWGEKGTLAYTIRRGGVAVLIASLIWLAAVALGYPDVAFYFIGISIIAFIVLIGIKVFHSLWNG